MTDPLAAALAQALADAQHAYRTQRGFGCYVTPVIPKPVIDGFAESLAPIVRHAARDALTERLDADGVHDLADAIKESQS